MAKNIQQLLVDATKYPAAVEGMLPEGAPAISATLADVAGKIPVLPDFIIEIPDLPAVPELPQLPALPGPPAGNAAGLPRFVTGARVTPVTKQVIIPSPAVGVIPEVITRRGL